MAKAFGIITSSAEHKVDGMQDYRSISAFSFLGRYRVVDFPISNLSNSGIINIQLYNSNKPRSLAAHVGRGRHYNINSKRGRLQLLFPEPNNTNPVYNTNISAMLENIEYIRMQSQDYVVIVPSCMVFRQDFAELLDMHVESGADITTLYHKVHHARDGYETCHTFTIDGDRLVKIERNLGDEDIRNISMETFVMKKSLLIELLYQAQALSSMYNLSDIIDAKLRSLDVRAVEHTGYFGPITSLKSFYTANMQLLNPSKAAELFTPGWPIYTRTSDSCPTHFYDEAEVKNSLISNGSEVHGTILDSIIGRGVTIAKGAVVKGCYISAYSVIGENVRLENQIVDKYAEIGHSVKICAPQDQPGYIKRRDKI